LRWTVTVTPNARKDSVEPVDGGFRLHVRARALDGKANQAVISLLAKELKVKKSAIRIVRGAKGRAKVVEVES